MGSGRRNILIQNNYAEKLTPKMALNAPFWVQKRVCIRKAVT